MGLWEDAQKHRQELDAAERRQQQWQEENRRREADLAAAQQAAVQDFIAATGQLGIAPQKHRWLEVNTRLGYGESLSRHRVQGWSARSPRFNADGGIVVTPNGDVYTLKYRRQEGDRRPLDPSRQHRFGGGLEDPGTPLVEILRDGLVRAMQGH